MTTLKHIGIIPDGNRRWARKRNKMVSQGHKSGAENMEKIIHDCFDLGIPQVTIWVLSTENLKRSKKEVNGLFKLSKIYINKFFDENMGEKYKANVNFFGDLSKLPEDIVKGMKKVSEKSKKYKKRKLNIMVAYGGRFEIKEVFNKILESGKKKVDEDTIIENLFVKDDVDLVIRTGAMKRLSGFMPYQTTYSELYFTDTLWPDFNKRELLRAVKWFNSVKRNFGK